MPLTYKYSRLENMIKPKVNFAVFSQINPPNRNLVDSMCQISQMKILFFQNRSIYFVKIKHLTNSVTLTKKWLSSKDIEYKRKTQIHDGLRILCIRKRAISVFGLLQA